MPRHERVSPEEDLASYYPQADGAPQVSGAASPPIPAGLSPSWPADGFEPDPDADPNIVAPGRLAPVQRPAPSFAVSPTAPDALPNPGIAALISLLVPGAGQIYAGQTTKGVVLVIVAFGTCFGGGILNVLAAVDALLIAQRKARGETVGDWQFF